MDWQQRRGQRGCRSSKPSPCTASTPQPALPSGDRGHVKPSGRRNADGDADAGAPARRGAGEGQRCFPRSPVWALTEALRVELPAHRADAGLPRLPLLQPQVQLLLQVDDVQAGAGRAGHLLHPPLVILLPLPVTTQHRASPGAPPRARSGSAGPGRARARPRSPRRQDGVEELLRLLRGLGGGGGRPGRRDGPRRGGRRRGPLQRAGLRRERETAERGRCRAAGSLRAPRPAQPRSPRGSASPCGG